MGQINISDMYHPTLLADGVGTILLWLMLMGPIVAFICLFKKNISVFLKRASLSAIVFIAAIICYGLWTEFNASIHTQLDFEVTFVLVWCLVSILCWIYVLRKKEKPRERLTTILDPK